MTFRNAGSGENGSAGATSVQVTLSADVQPGDVIVIGLKWTGSGHTTFTPSSSNGGTFTDLTGLLANDTSSRAQAWQRDAVAGDASSTITINSDSSGRVACVWVAHHGVDGSDPVLQAAFDVTSGDMVFPAATPRVAWGADGGEVVYVGLARTPSGGQTVHSAGASGATLRVTVTNGAGSGNNANAGSFDASFAGSGEVAGVTTVADPDTAGRNTITLLYHAAAGGGGVTGTLAVTEADDTLAASGTFTAAGITGTLAVTEEPDTLAAAGTSTPPSFTGSLAVTEAADGLAASGSFDSGSVAGSVNVTEADDSLAAAGIYTGQTTGTLAVTEAADVITAAGTVDNSGVVAPTPAARTTTVPAESRTATIPEEDRRAVVPA